VHIGATGFLGLSIASQNETGTPGVMLQGSVPGTPAASAGLTQFDVVTSIDGQRVTSGTNVQQIMIRHHPGDKVSIGWTDTNGQAHTATVTLANGPAA